MGLEVCSHYMRGDSPEVLTPEIYREQVEYDEIMGVFDRALDPNYKYNQLPSRSDIVYDDNIDQYMFGRTALEVRLIRIGALASAAARLATLIGSNWFSSKRQIVAAETRIDEIVSEVNNTLLEIVAERSLI